MTTHRTTIRETVNGVQVREWDADAGEAGAWRTATYVVGSEERGGYVWSVTRTGDRQQVCEGLASEGHALSLRPGGSLLALIRREYRRQQRANARWDAAHR